MLKRTGDFSRSNPFRSISAIIGLFFALPFFIPGLCIIGFVAFMNIKSTKVASWEKTEASILEITPPDHDEPLIQYEYLFDGRWYPAEIGESTQFVNREDATEELFNKADAALTSEKPLPCWVNPSDPNEHTLTPPTPSPMVFFLGIFALSHGATGLGILLASLSGIRTSMRQRKLTLQHPEKPWKWREDWAANTSQIPPTRGQIVWIYVLVAWIVIGWWTTLLLWTFPETSMGMKLVGLLVSALGAVPVIFLRRSFKKKRLYKNVEVRFPEGGLVAGKTNAIEITATDGSLPADIKDVSKWSLHCERRERKRSHENTSYSSNTVLAKELIPKMSSMSSIQLEASISQSAQPTTIIDENQTGFQWTVRGLLPNGKETEPFYVPVYEVSGRPEPSLAEPAPSSEIPAKINITKRESLWEREKLTLEQINDTQRFTFDKKRHRMPYVTSLIIGIIFFLVGLVPNIFFDTPFVMRLFVLIFGVIGMFILTYGIREYFSSLIVDANSNGIRIYRSLGKKSKTRIISAEELQDIEVSDGATYNNTLYYTVHAKIVSGKKVKVSPLFENEIAASAYAEALLEATMEGE